MLYLICYINRYVTTVCGSRMTSMLPFNHLKVHSVILQNSDLSYVWIVFYVDDATCLYWIDGHDMNICSVLTPILKATFSQLTASSNIKNDKQGSYCIILTLSGLLVTYVDFQLSGAQSQGPTLHFAGLDGLSQLKYCHRNNTVGICNLYTDGDVKVRWMYNIFRLVYLFYSNIMVMNSFQFTCWGCDKGQFTLIQTQNLPALAV